MYLSLQLLNKSQSSERNAGIWRRFHIPTLFIKRENAYCAISLFEQHTSQMLKQSFRTTVRREIQRKQETKTMTGADYVMKALLVAR